MSIGTVFDGLSFAESDGEVDNPRLIQPHIRASMIRAIGLY